MSRRLQAEPEEDEQLLSLQWADENQTRAHVPMDLSCQFSLQSDEAAQSGGGRDRVVSSRKPQLQLLGRRQTEMEIFHTLLPKFVFLFSFPLEFTHHFRFAESNLAPFLNFPAGEPSECLPVVPLTSLWGLPAFPWVHDLLHRAPSSSDYKEATSP